MSTDAICLDQVSHAYGDHVALSDVSLHIAASTFFGLLGPNGSGKTTLFRILSTLIRPSSGTASVAGLDTHQQADAVRQKLGIVFQQPALDESLTVEENLRFQGALYGLSSRQADKRIAYLLDALTLSDRIKARVKTLSGGLKRRVDLARGLLHQPELLLLDEPTTGLDPLARHQFWKTLAELRQTEQTTVVVATHLLDEADTCDHIGILHQGSLVAHGAPETLKADLGTTTLHLTSEHVDQVAQTIETTFGLTGTRTDTTLVLTPPDAPALLPVLYRALGPLLQSATIRRPTLADVFLHYAGTAFQASHAVSEPSA